MGPRRVCMHKSMCICICTAAAALENPTTALLRPAQLNDFAGGGGGGGTPRGRRCGAAWSLILGAGGSSQSGSTSRLCLGVASVWAMRYSAIATASSRSICGVGGGEYSPAPLGGHVDGAGEEEEGGRGPLHGTPFSWGIGNLTAPPPPPPPLTGPVAAAALCLRYMGPVAKCHAFILCPIRRLQERQAKQRSKTCTKPVP